MKLNLPMYGMLFVLVLAVGVLIAWVVNAVDFFQCDFEPPYKCEIVHGVGIVVPPFSLITVWFDDEES